MRLIVHLGETGGAVQFDRFECAESFQLALFAPERACALNEDVTGLIKASRIKIYSNVNYVDSIKRLAPWWNTISEAVTPLENTGKSVFLCSEQCRFIFDSRFCDALPNALEKLMGLFLKTPFHGLSHERLASRYADRKGVILNAKNLPMELRPLLPLAGMWSIGNEDELAEFLKRSPPETIESFLNVFEIHGEAIDAYCDFRKPGVVVPDEVVVFQIASRAYGVLRKG